MLCILFYKVYLNILSFLILYQLENYKMILTFQFLAFTCLNPRGKIKKMLYVDFEFHELLGWYYERVSTRYRMFGHGDTRHRMFSHGDIRLCRVTRWHTTKACEWLRNEGTVWKDEQTCFFAPWWRWGAEI